MALCRETMPAVLDNLFQTPEPWKRDNIAGLLLFCSEKVKPIIINKIDSPLKGTLSCKKCLEMKTT